MKNLENRSDLSNLKERATCAIVCGVLFSIDSTCRHLSSPIRRSNSAGLIQKF